MASCDKPSGHERSPTPLVQNLVSTLEDEVRELPNERIAWSTFWKLCWDKTPDANAYELQTLTSEGSSGRVQRQSENCFRIEAATGENKKSEGLLNRQLQLALQSSQLAYRVRAVLDNGRVGEWSPSVSVGATTHVNP
ncbi:MAG TPA: hypothetical protein VGO73_14495 [Pyrinomonadaceae bacterium]|nr:hypothetical protein [Pyrinomonadaceae bacterium]